MSNTEDFFNRWPAPDESTCPPEDVLVDIAHGKRIEQWSGHVESCEKCARVISTLKLAEARRSQSLNEFMQAVALKAEESRLARKPSLWEYLKGFYAHRGWSTAIPAGALAAFGAVALVSWPNSSGIPAVPALVTVSHPTPERVAAKTSLDQLMKMAQTVQADPSGTKPILDKVKVVAQTVENHKAQLSTQEKAAAVNAEFTIKVARPAYVAAQPETERWYTLFSKCLSEDTSGKTDKAGCEKMTSLALNAIDKPAVANVRQLTR
jgi:hypothetical protein